MAGVSFCSEGSSPHHLGKNLESVSDHRMSRYRVTPLKTAKHLHVGNDGFRKEGRAGLAATPQGGCEPTADPSRIRCVRSQRIHRCNLAKIVAATRREKPPFRHAAAMLQGRMSKMRTLRPFGPEGSTGVSCSQRSSTGFGEGRLLGAVSNLRIMVGELQ